MKETSSASALTLSIIVPAYNEQDTILEVLEAVNAHPVAGVRYEILVVDDGSKDETVARVRRRPDLYARLLCQPTNGGKGAAVRAALAVATGDYVLFQDADLEYDPADFAKLLFPVLRFDADVVVGSRFLAPQYTRVHYLLNKVGNVLVTGLFDVLYNKTFTDIYSCYLLFRRSLLTAEELRADGWDQHAEILCKCVKRSIAHYEVPVSYHGRTYAEGKKIRALDILPVLGRIVTEYVRR